jgi:hypothetical protein
LRCCVNRGRPFGDPNWVTDTAKRLGLESTIRPCGRPKKQSQACHNYLYYLDSSDLVAVTFAFTRFGGCHLCLHTFAFTPCAVIRPRSVNRPVSLKSGRVLGFDARVVTWPWW